MNKLAKRPYLIFSSLVLLLTSAPAGAETETAERPETSLLYIVDASFSMNQSFGSQSKLEAVKEALPAAVRTLPSEASAGLEVLGHRSGGDCQAGEILVPISEQGGSDFAPVLAPIVAQGPRPLAQSLIKGAEELRSVRGRKVVVLVADGADSCGGDGVGAVRAVKTALGPQTVIHVIGVKPEPQSVGLLQQMASTGGGSYFSAADIDGLRRGFQELPASSVSSFVWNDYFESELLDENWDVINPAPENRIHAAGVVNIKTVPGSLEEGNVQNLLLYRGALPENYSATLKYGNGYLDRTSTGFDERGGAVLYGSNTAFVWIGVVKTKAGSMSNVEVPGGKEVTFRMREGGNEKVLHWEDAVINAGNVHLVRITKIQTQYLGFYSADNVRWYPVGAFTVLESSMRPGIAAFRETDEEVNAPPIAFDDFEVLELPSGAV